MTKEKKKRKEIKLFTLDTETRGLEGDMFRIGLFDGKQYYTGYTFADVLPVLDRYKEYECHVFIHNLDFDLSKIIKELRDYAEPSFNNSLFINGNIVTFTASHIILHDSFRLLPSSLENLCRDFELEEHGKMDILDYMVEKGYGISNVKKKAINQRLTKENFFKNVDKDDPILCEYMEYDCRSLYKIIEIVLGLSELPLEHFVKCPTTASLAKTVYKEQYSKWYKIAVSTKQYNHKKIGKDLENFIRQGYYGGRTEVFTPRITDGFHYDVNSLYPYVMKNAEMPVGYPNILYDKEEIELSYGLYKRRKFGAGFIHAKVYVPEDMYIPVLPKKDYTGKLIFPVGRIEGVWTFPELALAEAEGCTIESFESAVVFEKTEPVFREFVTYFEAIKNTSKGAKRTFAKLMQNALYGKFAMQRERIMYADVSEREALEKEGHTVHKIIYNMNGVYMEFLEYDGYAMAEYIQPHISAYITSIARIILYKGLKYSHEKGILAYCDTDSCATTTRFPEKMVHDKEYGKWKLEGVVIEGLYFQPKMYAEKTYINGKYKEVLRMKGVPKWVVQEQLDYDSFRKWYLQIKHGKEQIPVYKNGSRVQKFLTKSKNNIEMNELAETRKTINFAREQKRNIDYKKNTTSPLKRYDYGEQRDEKAINQFDEWCQRLEEFNDDMSAIEELCLQYGKILLPEKRNRKLYSIYKEYSSKAKELFSVDGVTIQEWCEKTGWQVKDLLGELSFL